MTSRWWRRCSAAAAAVWRSPSGALCALRWAWEATLKISLSLYFTLANCLVVDTEPKLLRFFFCMATLDFRFSQNWSRNPKIFRFYAKHDNNLHSWCTGYVLSEQVCQKFNHVEINLKDPVWVVHGNMEIFNKNSRRCLKQHESSRHCSIAYCNLAGKIFVKTAGQFSSVCLVACFFHESLDLDSVSSSHINVAGAAAAAVSGQQLQLAWKGNFRRRRRRRRHATSWGSNLL